MTRRINGDALENRDGTAVTGDVFVFDDAHVDGGEWEAPGAGSASAAWPVGSIFLSAVSTNPATLLGFGTWSAIGAGRVLIGINAADADFDTLGETGGAKTTAHSHGAGTLATSGGSWHSHGAGTIATVAESSHTHASGAIAVANHDLAHKHTINSTWPGLATITAHSGTAVANHSSIDHRHGVGTLAVASHPDHIHRTDTFPVHTHQILNTNLAHTHIVAAGQGSHQHGMAEGTTDGAGTYMDRSNAAAATTAQTDLATLPQLNVSSGGPATIATEQSGYSPAPSNGARNTSDTGALTLSHSVSGDTAYSGQGELGHSVTQPSAHTLGGETEVVSTLGAVTHSVSGSTGAGSSHSHGISGTTADEGAHTHGVSGSTGSDSPSVVQPYLVVAMWQRTA